MQKTRMITIYRTVKETNEDKKVVVKIQKFPCKINAGVPFSHRMCE